MKKYMYRTIPAAVMVKEAGQMHQLRWISVQAILPIHIRLCRLMEV